MTAIEAIKILTLLPECIDNFNYCSVEAALAVAIEALENIIPETPECRGSRNGIVPLRCPSCNNELNEEYRCCPNCGQRLKWE